MFKGYPDVIVCRVQNAQVPAFIAIVRDDGSAVYKALGGASANVTKDRVLHREGAKDCDGKTIDQLVKDGQTRDLKSWMCPDRETNPAGRSGHTAGRACGGLAKARSIRFPVGIPERAARRRRP